MAVLDGKCAASAHSHGTELGASQKSRQRDLRVHGLWVGPSQNMSKHLSVDIDKLHRLRQPTDIAPLPGCKAMSMSIKYSMGLPRASQKMSMHAELVF